MNALSKLRTVNWDAKIPWLFFAFFLVIFLANGAMVAVAVGTWTGLETERAYEEGLAYNDRLAERERQARLGWRVAAALDALGSGAAKLRVRLTGTDGQALYADSVRAAFRRPTLEGHDFAVLLEPQGAGLFGLRVDFPLPGQWDLELEVSKGDDRHFSRRRVHLAP